MGSRTEHGNDKVRFILAERWGPGPMVGYLGMNPSKASADETDQTWTRMRGFAQRWGCGGQIFANPVPFRSANPEDARAILVDLANGRNAWAADQMAKNLDFLHGYAAIPAAWVIGWGDKGAAMNTAYRCHRKALDALFGGGARTFVSFGLTSGGNPKHIMARGTSRVPDDAGLYEWRAEWRARGKAIALSEVFG